MSRVGSLAALCPGCVSGHQLLDLLIIEREFAKRPRNELESQRIEAVFATWGRRGNQQMPTEIYDCAPTITDLYVDDANRLWVEHSRSAEAGPDESLFWGAEPGSGEP